MRLSRSGASWLLSFMLLIAACSGGATEDGGATSAPPTTGSESATTAGEATDTTETEVQLEGDLRWASWGATPEDAARWIALFNEVQPGVNVEYEFNLYADYLNALRLAVTSGEAPDVFVVQPGGMAIQYAEFAEDLAPWAEEEWGPDWENRFFPGALSESTVDGKLIGMPDNMLAAGYVWYNADIFQEVGLEPPTTLDEMIALVEPLEEAGYVPFAHGAAENWVNFDLFMAIANQTAPGELYTAETGETSWTSPGLIEAMEIWRRLFDSGLLHEGALGALQYPDSADLFQQEEAAMILMGTWYNINMTQRGMDQRAEAYGIDSQTIFLPFRFPDVDGDGEAAPLAVGPGSFFVISNTSTQKEAAWEFVKSMISPPVLEEIYVTRHMQTSQVDIELDYSNVLDPRQSEALELQAQEIAASTYAREFSFPEVQSALGDALQMVASGQAEPEEALASVEAALSS